MTGPGGFVGEVAHRLDHNLVRENLLLEFVERLATQGIIGLARRLRILPKPREQIILAPRNSDRKIAIVRADHDGNLRLMTRRERSFRRFCEKASVDDRHRHARRRLVEGEGNEDTIVPPSTLHFEIERRLSTQSYVDAAPAPVIQERHEERTCRGLNSIDLREGGAPTDAIRVLDEN